MSEEIFESEQIGELLATYSKSLSKLAEKHLSLRLRTRIDPDEVVQSALRTFIARLNKGKVNIDSSTKLWRLLTKITVLKARTIARRHHAEKRSVDRESSKEEDSRWYREVLSREPDPDQEVILAEQVQQMLQGLPSFYSQLFELRLAKVSVPEIASQLAVSRQTIYRGLQLLEKRLRSN